MSLPYVYDAGALIAIESDDRRMWALHHLAVQEGRDVIVPAIVVGQVWRDGSRQVPLGRFLRACVIEPTLLDTAKAAGVLCGRAGTADIVDATVMVTAVRHRAIVFTSDADDLTRLADASGARPVPVIMKV
jgi:hypothetical protein